MKKIELVTIDEVLNNVDNWGAERPELNSDLISYGVAASTLVGIAAIGAPAIIGLAAYGGVKLVSGAKSTSYARFLVARMNNDPEFVSELKERIKTKP